MKHLHFDCFSGISGDMILGALVHAGLPFKDLVRGLARLQIEGFRLTQKSVERGALSAMKVDVLIDKGFRAPLTLAQIKRILQKSGLPAVVKEQSQAVFDRLADAEGKAHGVEPSKVHFHEVGVIDSFVDVVGGVLGLHLMGIQRVRLPQSMWDPVPSRQPTVPCLCRDRRSPRSLSDFPFMLKAQHVSSRRRPASHWCVPSLQNSVPCLECRCAMLDMEPARPIRLSGRTCYESLSATQRTGLSVQWRRSWNSRRTSTTSTRKSTRPCSSGCLRPAPWMSRSRP